MTQSSNIERWEKNIVLLHKDKKMKTIKESDKSQPVQLDLFQTLINNDFSNSVELYSSLPDLFSWKQDKLRNLDGSLPALSRSWVYKKFPYTLDITPANITITEPGSGKRTKKAFYKTVVAEFIENALQKLAVSDGFFHNNHEHDRERFSLITTYYQVREELKRVGKHYSYDQIRDGIAILAGLRYELVWEINRSIDIGNYFSPIELTVKNDKKNPLHSELYITFNKLTSNRILELDWRSYNYKELMRVKSSFGRILFKRLSHRFIQWDPRTGYHFLLSTLIKEGALQDDIITTNIKKIDQWILDCQYLIDRSETEKIYEINPSTNRKTIVDYKGVLVPTKEFQDDQFRVNLHHKRIRNYKINENGKAIIKPSRDQFYGRNGYKQYMEAIDEFESMRCTSR